MRSEHDPFWDTSSKIRALYRRLAVAVRRIGPFEEKPTKVSMNLVRAAVFVEIEPQLKCLRLTVKSESPLKDPRILRTSHATRTRWENDFKIGLHEEIDPEVMEWIRASYELCELPSQPAHRVRPRAKKPMLGPRPQKTVARTPRKTPPRRGK